MEKKTSPKRLQKKYERGEAVASGKISAVSKKRRRKCESLRIEGLARSRKGKKSGAR